MVRWGSAGEARMGGKLCKLRILFRAQCRALCVWKAGGEGVQDCGPHGHPSPGQETWRHSSVTGEEHVCDRRPLGRPQLLAGLCRHWPFPTASSGFALAEFHLLPVFGSPFPCFIHHFALGILGGECIVFDGLG